MQQLVGLDACSFISDVSLNMFGMFLLKAFVVNDADVITEAAEAIGEVRVSAHHRHPGCAWHGPHDGKICCHAGGQGPGVAGA